MTKTTTQKKTRTSPYQTRSKTRATTEMMHGVGMCTFSDGGTYDGEWQNGDAHGKGVRTYSDGRTYDGKWEYGEEHGEGVFTFPGHSISFPGEYKDGVFTYADGPWPGHLGDV